MDWAVYLYTTITAFPLEQAVTVDAHPPARGTFEHRICSPTPLTQLIATAEYLSDGWLDRHLLMH